jgi:hypothetical protein
MIQRRAHRGDLLDHGVSELITVDRDFARFPTLRTRSLLA